MQLSSLDVHHLVEQPPDAPRSGAEAAAAPITNAATRIKAIIEQVVDFTRAQADGVMPIVRKPGDLAQQLAKVVDETTGPCGPK